MNVLLKYLMTLMILNIMFGMMIGAYASATDRNGVANAVSQAEQTTTFLQDNELAYGTPDSDQQIADKSFGNQMSWGSQLFQIFIKGINPFSMPLNAENTLEVILFQAITWFRSIISIISLLYLFLLFFGKVTV